MGLILSAAQTLPVRADINANLLDHYHWIEMAATNGASLIVFPEMSITGYERENAFNLAFTSNDSRLNKLQELAIRKNIIVIAGAPILIEESLFIGSFVFQPNLPLSIYVKQFLHDGEEKYFTSSLEYNSTIQLELETINLAICADIDHPIHPEKASKNRSTLYITSIFFSPQGIHKAHQVLSQYAKKHQMNILMSNFVGESYGMSAGGKSGFWNNSGQAIISLNNYNTGLLLVEKNHETWIGRILYK